MSQPESMALKGGILLGKMIKLSDSDARDKGEKCEIRQLVGERHKVCDCQSFPLRKEF